MTSATENTPMDLRVPAGPRPHFLLGNLPEFGRDILGFFEMCARDYGDVVRLSLGGWPTFFLNNPDHFESVLVTNHRNFIKHTWFWRHVRTLFGDGLLVSEGDKWVQQRRLIQPAFHREKISNYGRLMVEDTERMLRGWRDGETRDVHKEMMHLTMDIVVRTLFAMEVSGPEAADVARAFDVVVDQIAVRFRRAFYIPDWIPAPNNVRFRRAILGLDRLMYRMIRDRRESGDDAGDLLSMLLHLQDESGAGMSDEQLRDEIVTMFLAGHETTALTLSWTWYLLSLHPDVEAQLHRELDEVLRDRAPRPEDVDRLPFTRAVILESMRLYPPAYAFGREAIHDCEIGGYTIPAGSTIFMVPWVIHRDARWFPQPQKFDPSRWTAEFSKALPPFAYLPFGGGPRRCIGNSFAMMEAILLLATIAREFRMRLVPDQIVEPFPSITLRPKSGIRMVIRSRSTADASALAARSAEPIRG
jgi:cytochrome P450